jgi:hypothetical protein
VPTDPQITAAEIVLLSAIVMGLVALIVLWLER